MRHLSEFLAKFKNIGLNNHLQKSVIAQEVNAFIGGSIINEKQIKVSRGEIFISAPSSVKSEVLISKKEILENINKKLPPTLIVRDIR